MVPSHFLNQCWIIVNWTVGNKFPWNFIKNSNIFISQNAFENVNCEMASLFVSASMYKCTLDNSVKDGNVSGEHYIRRHCGLTLAGVCALDRLVPVLFAGCRFCFVCAALRRVSLSIASFRDRYRPPLASQHVGPVTGIAGGSTVNIFVSNKLLVMKI